MTAVQALVTHVRPLWPLPRWHVCSTPRWVARWRWQGLYVPGRGWPRDGQWQVPRQGGVELDDAGLLRLRK